MPRDLKDFWRRLQSGVAVAVANPAPDRLLGVRDGFQRYFGARSMWNAPVVVVPQPAEQVPSGFAASDEEVLSWIGRRAADLEERLGDAYHFYLATEACLHAQTIDGEVRTFVRNWTVLSSPLGRAAGSSGSIEVPELPEHGGIEGDGARFAVPGRRRSGGLIASLTAGIETRREAVAESTFHALASLFYGTIEARG